MALWDLITEIREKAGETKKEFADRLGISQAHATRLEKPFEQTKQVPSEALIRKIADEFAPSEAEKMDIQYRLLVERAKLVNPPEIQVSRETGYAIGTMPYEFRERLRIDYQKLSDTERSAFNKAVKLTDDKIAEVIKGDAYLTREKVIDCAIKLKQPLDEYLLESDYITDSLKKMLHKKGLSDMINALSSLNAKDMNETLNLIAHSINYVITRNEKKRTQS